MKKTIYFGAFSLLMICSLYGANNNKRVSFAPNLVQYSDIEDENLKKKRPMSEIRRKPELPPKPLSQKSESLTVLPTQANLNNNNDKPWVGRPRSTRVSVGPRESMPSQENMPPQPRSPFIGGQRGSILLQEPLSEEPVGCPTCKGCADCGPTVVKRTVRRTDDPLNRSVLFEAREELKQQPNE